MARLVYEQTVIPNSPPEEQEGKETQNTPIYEMATKVIQQSIDLLSTLNKEQYTCMSTVMPGGTIGKHVRHVYDHFNLLYKQCNDIPSDWVVDYDIRARDNPSETDIQVAIDNLVDMQHKIQYYNYIPLQTNLTLLATIDASDDNKYKFDSSFGRELFYSCIHAIHHYASIKAICIELGVDVPHEFGMAPSTLQDQQNKKT